MKTIEVDFYADTFRSGELAIPDEIDKYLRGNFGEKDSNYWHGIQYLKKTIAIKLEIPVWNISSYEKLLEKMGRASRQPVQIIAIREVKEPHPKGGKDE